jgi:hypothetical protein
VLSSVLVAGPSIPRIFQTRGMSSQGREKCIIPPKHAHVSLIVNQVLVQSCVSDYLIRHSESDSSKKRKKALIETARSDVLGMSL